MDFQNDNNQGIPVPQNQGAAMPQNQGAAMPQAQGIPVYAPQPDLQANLKQARKDFSKLGFRLLFGSLALFGSVYLIQFLIAYFKPEWIPTNLLGQFLMSMVPQYFVGMPLMILILGTKKKNRVLEKRKVEVKWFFVFFLITYALMQGANMIGNGAALFLGLLFKNSADTSYVVQEYVTQLNPVMMFLTAAVAAPIMEELIFRKLIVDRSGDYGEAASALISGLAFGFFHGNVTQALYAFVMGYFMAIIYQKTGKIYITILLHMAINGFGSLVGSVVLRMVDLNALMQATASGDEQALINYISTHALGLLMLFGFYFLVFGFMVSGVILLIVNRRKFLPARGKVQLPRRSTFKAAVLNPGMICFCVAMIGYMVFYFVAR